MKKRCCYLFQLEDLDQRGVYAVVSSPAYQDAFIPKDEALRNSNVMNPYPEEKLEERWVPREQMCSTSEKLEAPDKVAH